MSANRGPKPKAVVSGGNALSQSLGAPSWMGQHGKAEWRRILPKLVGVALDVDYAALVAYCSAYQTMIEADIVIQREGIMMFSEKGTTAHPATRVKAQAMDQVRRYQTEFGLTPLARLRVQPSLPEGDDDDLAKMC